VHIAELILAAPDVDRDQFVEMVPIVRQVTKGMTLYASSMDRALVASKELAGAVPRAGLVLPPSDPIVLPDLETIDVSAVGAEMLGLNHNVFASNRELISDIHILLTSGKHAPRLPQVRQIPAQPAAAKFWRFVP
jgi:esterase/lipase superfamily enzyme